MLIPIETYRTCDFPEAPAPPSGSAHGFDIKFQVQLNLEAIYNVKVNPEGQTFSCGLERLVTLQNMMRYMILDILSGST